MRSTAPASSVTRSGRSAGALPPGIHSGTSAASAPATSPSAALGRATRASPSPRFNVSATGTASNPPASSSATPPMQPVDRRCAQTRPRRVVHEHPVVPANDVARREQPVVHARSARLSAAVERLQARAEIDARSSGRKSVSPGARTRNTCSIRDGRRARAARAKQGAPGELQVLLGVCRAHAQTGAGSGDEGVRDGLSSAMPKVDSSSGR